MILMFYLLCTVKICLQLILLSEGNFFLMIGSLEVTHGLILTVSFKLAQLLRFNLGKPQLSQKAKNGSISNYCRIN